MRFTGNETVDLIVTSPPYNVNMNYDEYNDDRTPEEYRELLTNVFIECKRVLKPAGRIAVNVANIGRKPYHKLENQVHNILTNLNFGCRGEIIWNKSKGKSGSSTAWGSWKSPSNPCLRDQHEYILLYSKNHNWKRETDGNETISKEEFMRNTKSVWNINPVSSENHPAVFPKEIPRRLIQSHTYENETVLDPFCGSGTTCVVAKQLDRDYIGYDTSEEYVELTRDKLENLEKE